MASISQVKLPDNTVYNIKGSIHSVIGTQTSATGSWTGNLTSIDSLYDGLTIAYYLPYAGSGNASLNLTLKDNTTTGAINCYLENNTRIQEHFKEGSIICLTYFSAGAISIGGTATSDARWIAQMSHEMVVLSYGSSTWAEFEAAYNSNSVVYCKASSNSNPATGVQGRMAFMAYVGFSSNQLSSVEFQYYRSVNSHSASQQGDQVYIYKLDKSSGWSVTVREAMSKIAAGTGLSSSYASGTITLSNSSMNTAGSTDSSDKLFLIGATSQAANPQTYSQDTAYVGTDGHLYSNSKQTINLSDSQALTNKTYDGYTLAAACAKAVDVSISSTSSTNLPTSAAVADYVDTAIDDAIVIGSTQPSGSNTKIWIKI